MPEAGKQTVGQAVVRFNPHSVAGDADGQDLTAWGGSGDFDTEPSALVSLKEVVVLDSAGFFGGGTATQLFSVNYDPPVTDQLEIEWSTSDGGQILGISYMIIGEA